MATSDNLINIHDHGVAIDEKKKKVRCNYCNKVVSGFFRLKCHLAGLTGDVKHCEQVPTNVKEMIKTKMLEAKRNNLVKEVGKVQHPDLPLKRNWRCNQAASSGSRNLEIEQGLILPKKAQECIGRFFYYTCIEFSTSSSFSFWDMINATCGQGKIQHKIPSCNELKGRILAEEVNQVQEYVNNMKESWESTGCSILLDEWVDELGRNLVHFLVDCPLGPVYLRSADISSFVGDIGALQSLLYGVIEEVGAENVVQIIPCSTTSWLWQLNSLTVQRHRTLFWAASASHCIGLMLEKMEETDSVRGLLCKAKTLTRFIYGDATMIKLFKNYSRGHDLVKPSKVRPAAVMPFFTLENILLRRQNLEGMFSSFEWKNSIWASRPEGERVVNLVEDPSFWDGIETVLNGSLPLVHILCSINRADKLQTDYLSESIDQAKKKIKRELGDNEVKYMPYLNIIEDIWRNYLHTPLHDAGYLLNPCLFYSRGFYGNAEVNIGIKIGITCSLLHMVEDHHFRDLITQQLNDYVYARGKFGEGNAIGNINISSVLWWSKYGGHCPELQKFAVRVLCHNCDGASKYGLRRSLTEESLANGRNPMEQRRLKDLTFVHYNLQLKNFQMGIKNDIVADEIDPLDDWIVSSAPEMVSNDNLTSVDKSSEIWSHEDELHI